MWSDNDIDNAFQRLNPPEPEPSSFPLDAWLRLETQLDKAVIERAVRRRVWRLFAAEVAVVALVALGWLLWPTSRAGSPKAAVAAQALASPATAGRPQATPQPAPATSLNHLTAAPAATPKATATIATTEMPQSGMPVDGATAAVASSATEAPVERAGAGAARPQVQPLVAVAPANTRRARIRRAQAARSEVLPDGAAASTVVAANSSRKTISQLAAGREYDASTAHSSGTAAGIASGSASRPRVAAGQGVRVAAAETGAAAIQPTRPARASSNGALSRAFAATGTLPTAQSKAANMEDGASLTPSAAGDETLLAPRVVPLASVADVALPEPLATVAVAAVPLPELPKAPRQPRLYVGLMAGPDVTTVKFAGVESPLPNVGLTVEYRLSSRLRVSTGLLRSTKQYMARRADYDFGDYGSYLNHRYFDKVDGTCTVLDVPLNLRYDFLARPHYQLYGSTGLSSFFMQREQYSYSYVEYNKSGYWSGESVNANQHLLSILNLSVGYSRTLSTHWSLQAEPYVKVPLAGVGAGKVKLTSAGVFFGVKYGF